MSITLKKKTLVGQFAILAFFVVFNRISIFHPMMSLALPLSFIGCLFLLRQSSRSVVIRSFEASIAYCVISLFFLFLINDILGSGAQQVNSLLSVRLLSIFIFSLLPAFFLASIIIRFKLDLKKIIFWAFLIQLAFWLMTFINPQLKYLIASVVGSEESVNLRDYNLSTRGFGLSREINYITPFMMVLVALTFYKSAIFKSIVIFTQIFNSNNVIVAIMLGLSTTKSRLLIALFMSTVFIFLIDVLSPIVANELASQDLFPRLVDELRAGGTRTLSTLVNNHFHVLNGNLFEFIFGTSEYVYRGNSHLSSDIGWILLLNHSGALSILLILYVLGRITFKVFGLNVFGLTWFIAAVWLNFKGLLIGPNGFLFTLFLLLFLKEMYRTGHQVDRNNR